MEYVEKELLTIADTYWKLYIRANPTEATLLGIKDYNERLPDISHEGIATYLQDMRRILIRIHAIDSFMLQRERRITRDVLIGQLNGILDRAALNEEFWVVDHMWGPQVWFLSLADHTFIESSDDIRNFQIRLARFGDYMDNFIANLRNGVAKQLTAPKVCVERTIQQLDKIAAIPVEKDPLSSVDRGPDTLALIRNTVRPAYLRYRSFLADELCPIARNKAGLSALPNCEDCYRTYIRLHTTLDLDPGDVFQQGCREMEKIRTEMEEMATHLFPGLGLHEVCTRLRDDPKYTFSTRREIEAVAISAVRRAEAILPSIFSVLPSSPVRVRRIQPYAERHTSEAYYQRPRLSGHSRSGTYYVNTYRPRTRLRFTAEALAFHEALPGHHLQISLADELSDTPIFQRQANFNAFTEGWALYAERLCDELGLYTSDIDRFGMLCFDAWRTARLVVDPGLHMFGWTRRQAIDYMFKNTAQTLPTIINEVDRYINWPGQGLSYKIGQLEFMRLREWSKFQLGEHSFNLSEFHSQVLCNGALPFAVLEREIKEWVRTLKGETQ